MAYLLIDGYNLIGLGHNDLEEARKEIIARLSRYSALKGHDITIVFDAWKREDSAGSSTKTGNVTVIYSRVAEKADEVIIKMLAGEKKDCIVISSDREISDAALRNDMAAISSDEFERKLDHALASEDYESERYEDNDDEEDYRSPAGLKGNPKKLSKNDKRRSLALNKL
ncbi:MAG: NYN domain-containing protein [Thermodesulfovibrionia bacterium]|nr:NYN domain-containing protein [Thermodesulfovibrionia bacterium]